MAHVRSLAWNWDGYGADPISQGTIARMSEVLDEWLPENVVAGSIVPGADGSLQAEWHLQHIEMGVVVEADDTVSAWLRSPGSDHETEAHGMEARDLIWSVANTALI